MTKIMNYSALALSLTLSLQAPVQAKADAADLALEAALAASEACPQNILDLTAETPQQIGVLVLSPCHAGETVVVDHAGLVVQTQLASNGALYIALPNGQTDEAVTVTYRDGSMQEAYLAPPVIEHIQDVAARW